MSRTGNRVGKVKRANRACDNCRKRKIKCSGFSPCLNCIASGLTCNYKPQGGQRTEESFFKAPTKLHHDVCTLKESLAGFSDQLPSGSLQLKSTIKNAIQALEKVDLESCLEMEYEKFDEYKESISIESEMVNKLHLMDRFASNSKNAANLSTYFGFYSPLIFFSPMGISHMTKGLLQYRDDRGTHETIYLLLKFLDVSTISHVMLESSAYNDRFSGELAMADRLEDLLSKLPPNIGKKLAVLDSSHLETSNDRLVFCTRLIQTFQDASTDPKSAPFALQSYIEAVETLAHLCHENYRQSVFAGLADASSQEVLIALIEQTYWTCNIGSMGKVIAHTCRGLLDGGYNRWEYNLGLQESMADRNRKLWWRCYWWDRWYAMNTGKPPLLSEEANNCLFPLNVLRLHVNDEMDCLTLAREAELQDSTLESRIEFGYILLAKTIAYAFSAMLYSKDFTTYKLHASKHWKNSSATLANLKSKSRMLHDTFQIIEDKLIAVLLPDLEDRRCLELYMHARMTVACLCQALCGLCKRLEKCFPHKQAPHLNDLVEQSSQRLFETSSAALLDVLRLNDSRACTHHPAPISTFMLNITSHMISKGKVDRAAAGKYLLNISVMSAICRGFSELVDVSRIAAPDAGFLRNHLTLAAISCFIFTRMCSQAYMGAQQRSANQFLTDLRAATHQDTDLVEKALDVRSPLFVGLLRSCQQSSFSRSILECSRMRMEDLKAAIEGAPDPVDGLESASAAAWTLAETELDMLLSSSESFDLLNMLWREPSAALRQDNPNLPL